MPVLVDYFWTVPLLPLFWGLILSLLLAAFNLTMNRLSKPVLWISALCLMLAALITYSTYMVHNTGVSINKYLLDWHPLFAESPLEIGFLLDDIATSILAISISLLLLLIFFSHRLMHRKKGYVVYFIYMILFSSMVLAFCESINILELCIFWVFSGIFSFMLLPFLYGESSQSKTSQNLIRLDLYSNALFIIPFSLLPSSFEGFLYESNYHNLSGFINDVNPSGSKLIGISLIFMIPILFRLFACLYNSFIAIHDNQPALSSARIHALIYAVISVLFIIRLQPILDLAVKTFI